MTLRGRIEEALRPLVGKRLWGSGRATDMEMFEFGERISKLDRHGNPLVVGEYALHVQCAWRFVGPSGIVVASRDVFEPPEGSDETPRPELDWEKGNRRDERMRYFLTVKHPAGLVVENFSADDVGGFQLNFNDNLCLEVFPHDSLPDEHWRLLKPGDLSSHFVVSGSDIGERGSLP